jgi:hypothetical protein
MLNAAHFTKHEDLQCTFSILFKGDGGESNPNQIKIKRRNALFKSPVNS